MSLRVLLCGSRNWTDPVPIRAALSALPVDSIVLHGAARGADTITNRLCLRIGIRVQVYPAEWERLGRSAGPRRNQRMLDEGKPHLVLAFPLPDSRGTWDMVRRAQAAGIRTLTHLASMPLDVAAFVEAHSRHSGGTP